MNDLHRRLGSAVGRFWQVRTAQFERQGSAAGEKDRGSRGAVTGGAQLDGIVELVHDLLVEQGLPEHTIYRHRSAQSATTLPGFFRPAKDWDLLVVAKKRLLVSIELKSQIGPSFGNNFNNRAEEAVGSANDLWTAYRDGAFEDSPRPWLGYFMLLEDAEGSRKPVSVREPHFDVFQEFRGCCYAERYEILCKKLLRERLYDGTCLILTDRNSGPAGQFREPCEEISFTRFMASLSGKAAEYLQLGN